MEDIKKIITDLIVKLKQWEYEYYALEQPTVADAVYDETLKQLIELEQQYPQFKQPDSPTVRVGGYVSDKFEKYKHNIPMLSLSNAFDEGDLIKFDNDIKKELQINNVEYVVEPKIDGLSISLIYKDGFLYKAVTRGDGIYGEDVTANIKTIKNIPLSISYKGEIEMRGEIFLDKKTFNEINDNLEKKFANARNAASGSLRNLDTKITASRKLKGYFYYVPQNNKLNLFTQYEILKWLQKNQIMVSKDIIKCNNIQEVIARVKYLTEYRDNFLYDIDGIVIKVNNINYYDEIGYTSKFPKWAIAYKFPANIKQSKLLSIEITVGRTGKINFIANLQPIELDGSIVSKATLHNAEYILEKDIHINDYVLIYKAGDIIPKIIEPILNKRDNTIVKWYKPQVCPSCNSDLVQFNNEVDQYCVNENCKDKNIKKIVHFCILDAMNIEGISEMIITKLYENNFVTSISDLYLLYSKKEQVINSNILIKEKSFQNIITQIEKSKNNSLEKLIFGLGIKHVGLNAAKLLCKRFKNITNIANATIEELTNINEIGDKMANSVFEWFKNQQNMELINKLIELNVNTNYIDDFAMYKVSEDKLIYMNKNYVITGSFSQSRNIIKNILESVFFSKVSSSVTKKTDYIIIGKNYTESKLNKANELNVKVIQDEFWNLNNID